MRVSVKAAIIGAVAVIFAAIIAIIGPWLLNHKSDSQKNIVIAGTVVDRDSNRGIGQAKIVVVGRSQQYVTEDNGNFRIEFPNGAAGRFRIHVEKDGYVEFDTTVEPPEDSLIWPLHKP